MDDPIEKMTEGARARAKQAAADNMQATEAQELRFYAAAAQKLADEFTGEVLESGKPSVMVFQALGDQEGTEGNSVYAGILVHVCLGSSPRNAMQLLAQTLHDRVGKNIDEQKAGLAAKKAAAAKKEG